MTKGLKLALEQGGYLNARGAKKVVVDKIVPSGYLDYVYTIHCDDEMKNGKPVCHEGFARCPILDPAYWKAIASVLEWKNRKAKAGKLQPDMVLVEGVEAKDGEEYVFYAQKYLHLFMTEGKGPADEWLENLIERSLEKKAKKPK